MITKIDNDADHFATLQSVDLESARWGDLVAALAALADDDEDFELVIRRALLPDAYKVNPSALARQALNKSDLFQSYGTYSLSRTHLGIKLLRGENKGRQHITPIENQSVVSRIRSWLDSDKESALDIPMQEVPDSWRARPEQLVYHIKRLTEQRIKITKLKLIFRISLK